MTSWGLRLPERSSLSMVTITGHHGNIRVNGLKDTWDVFLSMKVVSLFASSVAQLIFLAQLKFEQDKISLNF